MQDKEVVESKLRFLREYLEDLKEFEYITLSDYKKSKKEQRFVERTLHLACESCLDIASHIISRSGFREPRDNKDLFTILFENSINDDQSCKCYIISRLLQYLSWQIKRRRGVAAGRLLASTS